MSSGKDTGSQTPGEPTAPHEASAAPEAKADAEAAAHTHPHWLHWDLHHEQHARRRRLRHWLIAAAVLGLLLPVLWEFVLPGSNGGDPEPAATPAAQVTQGPDGGRSAYDEEHAVAPPGPLQSKLLGADLMVLSSRPLSPALVKRVGRVKGVLEVNPMSISKVSLDGQVVTIAAVDPARYRRFTPASSAQLQEAWTRVAGGEAALDPRLGRDVPNAAGSIRLGNDADAPSVHVGAFVPQVPRIDVVVNHRWGDALKMPRNNALLLATGRAAPQRVRAAVQKVVGEQTSVQILGPNLDLDATQTAFLVGGSVADAVGTFSYRLDAEGRVTPDPAWVAENIRTETVPILGSVTCHKVLLPQLRAALTEVSRQGLASAIHPGEYAGCYYPRYIANTDQMSLHAFGIALDLNVPGNQRGTKGEIDPRVVDIFKQWGFAWGGDWAWTDPMHFELNRLVEPR